MTLFGALLTACLLGTFAVLVCTDAYQVAQREKTAQKRGSTPEHPEPSVDEGDGS